MNVWSAGDGYLRVLPFEKRMPLSEFFEWVSLRLQLWEANDEKYSPGVHNLDFFALPSEHDPCCGGPAWSPPGG